MFYSLVNKILQSTLRIYVEKLFDLNERPIQTQEEILLDFIAKAKNTAFGRLHHFDSIHDYKDYVSKVPLHEYGDLKPYINQMRHGDKDILLGNWGLNTKFKATPENPLRLYYGDFDANNKKETVLTYSKKGKEYPVNSKNELAAQMNRISTQFVTHKNYALKTVEEVLTQDAVNKATKFTVNTLASGYLENNKGTFTLFKQFPKELQVAPITNFNELQFKGKDALILSGNSLRVNTYHGGYTSLKGILLNSISEYQFVSDLGMTPFSKQIKSVKVVEMKNEKRLLVVSNNDSLQSYSFKK